MFRAYYSLRRVSFVGRAKTVIPKDEYVLARKVDGVFVEAELTDVDLRNLRITATAKVSTAHAPTAICKFNEPYRVVRKNCKGKIQYINFPKKAAWYGKLIPEEIYPELINQENVGFDVKELEERALKTSPTAKKFVYDGDIVYNFHLCQKLHSRYNDKKLFAIDVRTDPELLLTSDSEESKPGRSF